MARPKGQSKKTGNKKPRHEDDEGSDQERITPTGNVKRVKKRDSGPEKLKKAKASSDTRKRTKKATEKAKEDLTKRAAGSKGMTSKRSGDSKLSPIKHAAQKQGKVKNEKPRKNIQDARESKLKAKVPRDFGKTASVPAESKSTQTPPMPGMRSTIFQGFSPADTHFRLEEALVNPTPQNTKRPRQTWGPFDPPITKHAKIPEGWNPTEYDIDEQYVVTSTHEPRYFCSPGNGTDDLIEISRRTSKEILRELQKEFCPRSLRHDWSVFWR